MARQTFKKQADVSPATGGVAGKVLGEPRRPDRARRSVAACPDWYIPSTPKFTLSEDSRLLFNAFPLSNED